MKIGVLQIELLLSESHSLKYKRSVLRRLKGRVKNKFNVSIAEVDEMGKWKKAVLGVAAVSNDVKHISRCLDGVINVIEDEKRIMVLDYGIEVF